MNTTKCDTVREYLLSTDWNAEQRRQAAEALQHAEECQQCRDAVGDFDRLRAVLAPVDYDRQDQPMGGWEAMNHRLADLIKPTRQLNHNRPPLLRPSFAIAASIAVIAASTFEIGKWAEKKGSMQTSPNPQWAMALSNAGERPQAAISAEDVSHDVKVFQTTAAEFDGQAGWAVDSKDRSNYTDMGIAQGPVTQSKKLLLLRLDLWHGRSLVSDSDLMVLAGQTADLTVPLENDQSLHYRIATSGDSGEKADSPAHLDLMLELKTPLGNSPLAALTTNLQLHPDQKVTAGRLTTSAGEYELKIEFKEAPLPEKAE